MPGLSKLRGAQHELMLSRRKKAANENRLQDKKKAAFKKSERRAKIDW